ncbi:DUF7144 family membrane protein [Salsipaludibacter albus]|uniref:DUF7144 family membrane protein n=1 Tax=Salsipaludibacter albus TaxID=2849650 RepID=UPI001EE4A696|nr:hypothetical protein [Salsipaludibacter albus]MBY5161331.1 hypothetical protein [Salsipaludibacter albus]
MGDIPVQGDHDGVIDDGWSEWAVGWAGFAGVLLVIQGTWWILSGLVALFSDEAVVATQEYLFQFDPTTWGWIHLVLGTVIGAAGLGVFVGLVWARTVGVVMASLAALVAFTWMPLSPLWATVFLAASVAVIWALTAHGRDIAQV